MPILCFDLSHLRVAVSGEGIYEFHPNWHINEKTFAGARGQALTELGEPHYHTEKFFEKYERRGYKIVNEDVFKAFEGHSCYTSDLCPLTLRSTTDEGVRFVPFTDAAAISASVGPMKLLHSPVVYWKHGGRCGGNEGDREAPSIYDSNGIVGTSTLV